MYFSERTSWEPAADPFTQAVTHAGLQVQWDLTVANPTVCGLAPSPGAILSTLSAPASMIYSPDPFGMSVARSAVANYYAERHVPVLSEQICLTTSTSEAYSFLFRTLCDAGDEVLAARPSYPLFDVLAKVEDVRLGGYPLQYEHGFGSGATQGWGLDLYALQRAVTPRTRAVLAVHPNNPTGNFIRDEERAALVAFCAERRLALIVDEVFLDYTHEPWRRVRSFAGEEGCLCFVLSGISKVCALPQMKVSWMAVSGPEALRAEALRRLEIVADTFLSLNAPAQHALGTWLGTAAATQALIRKRLRDNLQMLDERLRGSMGSRLVLEGGWTAVLRAPRYVDGDLFAVAALRRGVLVQPGIFYGLGEGHCVVSLLTEPQIWRDGLAQLPL